MGDSSGRTPLALLAALMCFFLAAICLGMTINFVRLAHIAGISSLAQYLNNMEARGLDVEDIGPAAIAEAYKSGAGTAVAAALGYLCAIEYYLLYDDNMSDAEQSFADSVIGW